MKLMHPESEQTIEPKAEHAEAYISQGWAEAATPEKPKAK